MEKLSIPQIIDKINNQEVFSAVADDYSFTLKIDEYVPYLCAAIHDGHQFRKKLWNKCLHTEYERWYEEDPETKKMIQNQPIVLAGRDSRFEYDLNRSPAKAIYDDAWGKQLWKEPLTTSEKEKSLKKHQNFYKVVKVLIAKLEQKFGVTVVYDMHSYNRRRWNRKVPVFNLGTSNIDTLRFNDAIEAWQKTLQQIKLPNNIETTSKINDVFKGNGYFLKFITDNFNNTLVLATEVSKIYCNELEEIIYPEVVEAIKKQLTIKLTEHASDFYKKYKSN
jgi:hypothetical protein